MLSRVVRRAIHSSSLRSAEAAAAVGGESVTKVNLNLSTPGQSFYENTPVDLVVIPGLVGEYGVTAGHTPVIAQMKPGVIQVHHEREKQVEKFFTAGGFAFTHENSTTDLACVEAVNIDDIDIKAVTEGLAKSKLEMESAAEGSVEKVDAQIAYEAYQAMQFAVTSSA